MPHGYLKANFESVAGNETNTPTLSTKSFYPAETDFTYDPGTNHMERDDENRGSEEPLSVIPEAYAPLWTLTARAYPDLMGWLFKALLGPPTTTAGDGVITDPDGSTIPATAFRHVWKSTDTSWGALSAGALANPMTQQIIAAFKDQNTFVKMKGCACDAFAINNPATGGVGVSASGPALYADDGIADPALTPSYESASIKPFTRGGLTLPTWLTNTGIPDDFGVAVTAPVDAVRSLTSASKWPTVMEKGDGIIAVTGNVAQHQVDPDDLAALRNATGFPIKAKWASDSSILATAYKYAMWIEGANAQYTSGSPSPLANLRRIGSTFNWKLTTAGAGVATTITVCNSTASYA